MVLSRYLIDMRHGMTPLPLITAKLLVVIAGLVLFNYPAYPQAYTKSLVLHEWYSHYYLHKDTKQVVAAMNYFLADNFPASIIRKQSTQGFFSLLFNRHPDQAVKWISNNSLSMTERKPLILALAQAGMPDEARELARKNGWTEDAITHLSVLAGQIPTLRPLAILTAGDTGWLWGAFKATGQTTYLDRIVDKLLQTLTPTSGAQDIEVQTAIIQALLFQRNSDDVVARHFQDRYTALPIKLRDDLDILLASQAEGNRDVDCD